MPVMTEPKLISGNANRPLAASIARRMSMHRGMNVGLCDARIERYYPRDFISSGGNQPPGPDYFLPDNFSFYGIRLSTDMRYEREYTRATRPFASIARTWHSILGAGYDLRLGLAGSVLGADHLALSFGMGKAGTQTNAPVRDLFLNYRIHF